MAKRIYHKSGHEVSYFQEAFVTIFAVPLRFNMNGVEEDLKKFVDSLPVGRVLVPIG